MDADHTPIHKAGTMRPSALLVYMSQAMEGDSEKIKRCNGVHFFTHRLCVFCFTDLESYHLLVVAA